MGHNLKQASTSTGTFSPIPEGRYILQIDSAEPAMSKNNSEMIKVQYSVLDGKFKGRKVFSNFSLATKALVFVSGLLKALGSKIIDEEDAPTSAICKELLGKRVSAWIEIKAGDMGDQNTVSKFQPINGEDKTKGLFV